MSPPLSVAIIGATGLVGNSILKFAESSTAVSKIVTITRNGLKYKPTEKVNSVIEDTSKWEESISSLDDTNVFISAFGTTKAAAGGAENFKKIDYGINYEAAKAARAKGIDTYVLISSMSASSSSHFFYLKTKGQLEDDVIALKFPRTIILRPGVLLGDRTEPKGGFNDIAAAIGKKIHNTFIGSFFMAPVHADEIASATLKLIEEPIKGDGPQVRVIEGIDINKLAHSI